MFKRTVASRVQLEFQNNPQNINVSTGLKYTSFTIENVQIPHIWNYLPAGQYNFTDSLGAAHFIAYPASQPSVYDIQTIANNLTTADTGGAVYTFAVDLTTLTWKITSTGNFGLNFDVYFAQHSGLLNQSLGGGRYGVVFGVNIIQSQKFFFGSQKLLLKFGFGIAGQGTSFDNYTQEGSGALVSTNNSTYVIDLPIKSAITESECWYFGELANHYDLSTFSDRISFEVVDEFGNKIDVSPQRMYVTICFYC